jgi:hypothetical protein
LERCHDGDENGSKPPIATPTHNLVAFAAGASSFLPALHPACGFRAERQKAQAKQGTPLKVIKT